MRIWNTSDKMNKDTEETTGRKRWQVVLCAVLVGVLCLGLVGSLTGGILEAMAQNNITDSEDADSEDGLLLAATISEDTESPESDGADIQIQEEDSENGTEETADSGTEACYDYTDVIEVPDVEFPYYIKVNRLANCVTVYTLDEDGEYTVPIKAMVCSVGLNNHTPLGVYTTSDKYDWRYLYGDVYGQYAYRITGSILFHSVPYYTMNKDDLETEEYNKLGEAASQGCIRLSCADAKWLIDNCPSGTTVEIYDDEDPGPLGKPEAITIDTDSPYAGWDPTDPDPENPWNQTEDELETVSKDAVNDVNDETTSDSNDAAEVDDNQTTEADITGDAGTDAESESESDSDTDTGSSSDSRNMKTPQVEVIDNPLKLMTGYEDDFEELMEDNLIIECEDDYKITFVCGSLKQAFKNRWYGNYSCTIYVQNTKNGAVAPVMVTVSYVPY